MKTYCIVLIGFLLCACQRKAPSEEQTSTEDSLPQQGIDLSLLQTCHAECDYLDIIFYELPLSVSQDELASIRKTFQFYSSEIVTHDAQCKSAGRLSYLRKGEIFLECEIYLDPGCQYFGFIENGKPVYFHAMTASAIHFFENIVGAGKSQ